MSDDSDSWELSAACSHDANSFSPSNFRFIILGGLAVGVLDGLYAVIFSALKGVGPTRTFQYITSGLVGRSAFSEGLRSALFGLLLHFLISFALAAIFYTASNWISGLRSNLASGLLYGVVVYLVMNFVVLPLSAAPTLPLSFSRSASGLIGHALLVGLPLSLILRRPIKVGKNYYVYCPTCKEFVPSPFQSN